MKTPVFHTKPLSRQLEGFTDKQEEVYKRQQISIWHGTQKPSLSPVYATTNRVAILLLWLTCN